MRPVRDLSDIARDAVMLAGMCEGLDVLNDAADALKDADPATRQARNAMVPMIEVIIEKARRLADDIEHAERPAVVGAGLDEAIRPHMVRALGPQTAHDPSVSQSRVFSGCFAGTFSFVGETPHWGLS